MAAVIGIVLIAAGGLLHWTAGGGVAATHDVDATGFPDPNLFVPQDITIVVGDTVRWTVTGTAPHDVTSDTDAFTASPTLSEGETFDVTFSTAGEFIYTCTIHSAIGQYPGGMTGKVIVQAASATATNTTTAPTATRTTAPSSTPSRTPTGTVTIVPSATPIATSTPVLATPFVEAVATQPAGGAAADIVAPNTGAGQTTDAPGASAIMLIASGLTLVAAAAALRGARLARK
jgi:plastocyanin